MDITTTVAVLPNMLQIIFTTPSLLTRSAGTGGRRWLAAHNSKTGSRWHYQEFPAMSALDFRTFEPTGSLAEDKKHLAGAKTTKHHAKALDEKIARLDLALQCHVLGDLSQQSLRTMQLRWLESDSIHAMDFRNGLDPELPFTESRATFRFQVPCFF
ncbi:hypothetical protein CSIM01_09434 [Colletotrichum simmondsii]|uniref:Uncharacterized protein n=1 Tax=Colletotrichum simmondsii TaxID=703756 RepID=A0A135S780_9PEZI|nr:hypothetical protein CSIM01_09434 [Colletotrichum simmondsii]